ncbi:MAG TPA: transposase [Tepidisphaeraceae bacterium]|nr:transposase [Tepidisphaeraceae bacterium]
MLTCKSPRKVMLVAHHLASQALPSYSCKFSRHDFTLSQLFACLCCKTLLKRSYREIEAVLRDSEHWCHAIGMKKVPDHNTLCRAAAILLKKCNTNKVLDAMARWAAVHRALGLSIKPLAGDSSLFELHHVSRHYENRRKRESRRAHRRRMAGKPRNPARALKRLPKLGIGVASYSHLALSAWCGTGCGSDSPHFMCLLMDAQRRVPHRTFTAVFDAGYDSEENHRLARNDLGLRSIIPPLIGRPTQKPPTYWRRHMKRLLRTKRSRQRCGYTQRWQGETALSMMKRNLGSELAGRTANSRKRDMLLRVLTHNVMIIRRQRRVETEQDDPFMSPG